MNITKYIGKTIAYYRDKKGWSTVQLADASDLSQGSISFYENGKRKPSKESLTKIAIALDITVDDIFQHANELQERNDGKVNVQRMSVNDYEYQKMKKVDRIYRFSDLVFELTPDLLISINAQIHDLVENTEYRGKTGPVMSRFKDSNKTLISHLVEKTFNDFLYDHQDELAFRLEEELKRLEINAYDLIDELRR